MTRLVFGALLSFLLVGPVPARACQLVVTPAQTLVKELKSDLKEIFSGLKIEGSELSLEGGSAPGTSPEYFPASEDYLIVPGKRAGPFHLGTGVAALRSQAPMGAPETKSFSRYADILPLGYVPKREFLKAKREKIQFGITVTKRVVREILVRDQKYHTAQEVRVGSPVSALDRQGSLKKHVGEDRCTYFQGDGVTFVVEEGLILEIVVRPGSASR